ncbi:CPBP family intramembrane metalloprotease [Akkermansiaceae bacterium]|nr:CPBP family intramembrane metalloprotease [Akkermansiaceae bacterium]
MSEDLMPTDGTCGYCGHHLDSRVYFCPGCAKPHRSIELGLTPSMPKFENIETRLRTGAPDVWTVFFAFLSAMMVSAFIGLAIWGKDNLGPVMLLVQLAIFVTTAFALVRYWADVRPLLAVTGFGKTAAWAGLALLIPMLALNYGYHSVLVALLDIEMEDYGSFFGSRAGAILFICVMPAVVEEIAFRGIIQHRFESVVGPWVAIAASSVLFSAAHMSILSGPYLAGLGALLGWMKWKSGSLYPPMLAHFAHNLVVISLFDT